MKRTRRKFTAAFKAQVALAALKERETLSDLATRYDIHPNLITKWKREFQSNAEKVFEKGGGNKGDAKVDIEKLYAKIGQLEMDRDFLKKSLRKTGLL